MSDANVGDVMIRERKEMVDLILRYKRFASCTPQQIADEIIEQTEKDFRMTHGDTLDEVFGVKDEMSKRVS